MKLFTIMTCTFNNSAILDTALKAVLGLNKFDEYVESVVIVDNASTDGTAELAKSYAARYPSVIKYVYEPKQGVAYARRHLTDFVTPWLIFVDDDNLLDAGYLETAAGIIEKNPDAGAINAAGIAVPPPEAGYEGEYAGEYNGEYLERLKAAAPALACSHYSLSSYKNGEKSRAESPYGAGAVLRVGPIKKFSDAGWTKNVGRSGGALTSGEDGEIIRSVLDAGYRFIFTDKTFFLHVIPPKRLGEDYLKRLFSGIGHGMYLCDAAKPDGNIITAVNAFKNRLKLMYKPFFFIFVKNSGKRAKIHYKSYMWKAYIDCRRRGGGEKKVEQRL